MIILKTPKEIVLSQVREDYEQGRLSLQRYAHYVRKYANSYYWEE